jgi:hypothetical protein
MGCLTCERLAAEFERLERIHTAARGHLDEAIGTSTVSHCRRARTQTNEAWIECELSRIELDQHRRTHAQNGDSSQVRYPVSVQFD